MPRSTNLVLRAYLFPESQLGSWELLGHKASFYQVSQGSGAKPDLISSSSHRDDPLPQDSPKAQCQQARELDVTRVTGCLSLAVLLWAECHCGMIVKMTLKFLCPRMSDGVCCQWIYYDVKFCTCLASGPFMGSFRVRDKHCQELWLNTRLPSPWP